MESIHQTDNTVMMIQKLTCLHIEVFHDKTFFFSKPTINITDAFSWPKKFADPFKNQFCGFNFHGFLFSWFYLFSHLELC